MLRGFDMFKKSNKLSAAHSYNSQVESDFYWKWQTQTEWSLPLPTKL